MSEYLYGQHCVDREMVNSFENISQKRPSQQGRPIRVHIVDSMYRFISFTDNTTHLFATLNGRTRHDESALQLPQLTFMSPVESGFVSP